MVTSQGNKETKVINNNRTKAGNKWEVGNVVKVGFLMLRVLSVRAEKDYLPDIYTLKSLNGLRRYEFIPHNGLHRIEVA